MNELQVVRIIWFALVLAILMYGGILLMTVREQPSVPLDAAFKDPIVLILHAIGVTIFAAAFVMGQVLRERAPARTALIVRWALFESISVFGLIAGFLRQDLRLFLPLGALALMGMLATYPSEDALGAGHLR